MKYLRIAVLLLLVGGYSCNGPKRAQGKPGALANRYRKIAASQDYSGDAALVDVKALVQVRRAPDTVKDNTKTVFDLKGAGQKELFSIFAQKDSAAQERLQTLLNQSFNKPESDPDVDEMHPALSIILSVELKDFFQDLTKLWSLGDRIHYLRVAISLPDESRKWMEFDSWDKVQTQYANYTAAGVSYSKSKSWNISPSVGIAGNTFSLGSYTFANNDSAADSLKYAVVLMTCTLTPDSLSVQEEGSPLQSLIGNTTLLVKPTFKYATPSPRVEFKGLRDEKGSFQMPAQVKFKEYLVVYPQLPKEGILANLELYYQVRHIIHNSETIAEGDDDIQYYTGHKVSPIHILKWDAVSPIVWGIELDNTYRLGFWDEAAGEFHEINFDSYRAANNFHEWLLQILPKTAGPIKMENYKLAGYDFLKKAPIFLNSRSGKDLSITANRD